MSKFIELIQERPVRFQAFIQAVFGLVILLKLLDQTLSGSIILIINSFLAFFLDRYTVAVDNDGIPRNVNYVKRDDY